ncbi:hypothetical protein ACFX13_030709 [Malus domestica]
MGHNSLQVCMDSSDWLRLPSQASRSPIFKQQNLPRPTYQQEHGSADAVSCSLSWSEQRSATRRYLVKVFEVAKQKNTITVLETGAGKTMIAVMLIKHVVKEMIRIIPSSRDKKLIIFLAPIVYLVTQTRSRLQLDADGFEGPTISEKSQGSGEYFSQVRIGKPPYASHKLLKEKARTRVQELRGMFTNIQIAWKEGRTANMAIFEDQMDQMLSGWSAELNDPSHASSLQGGSHMKSLSEGPEPKDMFT